MFKLWCERGIIKQTLRNTVFFLFRVSNNDIHLPLVLNMHSIALQFLFVHKKSQHFISNQVQVIGISCNLYAFTVKAN